MKDYNIDKMDLTIFELAHMELIKEGKYNYTSYDLLVYAYKILNWWNKHRSNHELKTITRNI